MTNEFARRLADNLKALNAKERDHLMRFSYLGAADPPDSERWLSSSMEQALACFVPEASRCVFAGMDYHLDWLHAALYFAKKGQRIVGDAKGQATAPESREWNDAGSHAVPPEGMDAEAFKQIDASLRPVTGSNEDVDLLAVFTGGKKRPYFASRQRATAPSTRSNWRARSSVSTGSCSSWTGSSPSVSPHRRTPFW